MTTDWAVSIEALSYGGDGVTEDALLELAAILEPQAGAVGGQGNLATTTITVMAASPSDAVTEGSRLFSEACEKAGLGPVGIFRVEAIAYDALDVALSEANFPALVGVSEIAEILGTNRQRASQVARTEAFPAPVAKLAMGPVWTEPDIRRFVAAWERKPGRPRKTAPAVRELAPSEDAAGRIMDLVEGRAQEVDQREDERHAAG